MVVSIVLYAGYSFAEQTADKCATEGIAVKNLTNIDLWYKKNGGDCYIWVHDHVLFAKPQDIVEIYSDLDCKTFYCEKNPTYQDYKLLDADGNCEVRILPDCRFSDI